MVHSSKYLMKNNGWIRFLNVLIVLCISATTLFSGLTALPIPVGIIDTKLAGLLFSPSNREGYEYALDSDYKCFIADALIDIDSLISALS